jgi:lysyl endopeptidase
MKASRLFVVAALSLYAATHAVAQTRAVPPLPGLSERGSPKVEALLTNPGVPAEAIELPAPTSAELAKLARTPAAKTGKGARLRVPLKIGIVREIDPRTRSVDSVALPWQALDDGRRAARIEVSSAGAAAVRIGIVLRNPPAGVRIRFVG